MIRGALIWVMLSGLAQGETLPALYGVTGVAAGDVLNIRAAPDAGADILGTLPRNAAAVEVVGLSPDGKWARVNTGETSGYAALRFLRAQPGPGWFTLKAPLRCSGTEPFWSLAMSPGEPAVYSTPEGEATFQLSASWPGTSARPLAGFETAERGFATLEAGLCSDGMSDRGYGILARLFLTGGNGPIVETGCCSLQP